MSCFTCDEFVGLVAFRVAVWARKSLDLIDHVLGKIQTGIRIRHGFGFCFFILACRLEDHRELVLVPICRWFLTQYENFKMPLTKVVRKFKKRIGARSPVLG